DKQEKGVNGAIDPDKFECAARERTLIDGGAVGEGNKRAIFDPAGNAVAFQLLAEAAKLDHHPLGRAQIKRREIGRLPLAAAPEARLVIACENTSRLVIVMNAEGREG